MIPKSLPSDLIQGLKPVFGKIMQMHKDLGRDLINAGGPDVRFRGE